MENNELKEKVRKNVKEKIAISNIRKEFNMKPKMPKFVNIVAMIMVIVVVGALSTQLYAKISWDIKFKEFQNREYIYGTGTVKEAFENGYGENIEMNYIEQDGIKVKVDSLIMTDDYFATNISFEFPEEMELNSETFEYGYAIYDENNNIYGMNSRYHYSNPVKVETYWKYLYKEIGKKESYIDLLCDSATYGNIKSEGRNITSEITLTSDLGFPKSKKLYIRVYDLGYHMFDLAENYKDSVSEDFKLSDAEWIFEIDLPEKFYNRQRQELKLQEEIPGVELSKFYVTEVGTMINIKSEKLVDKLCSDGPINANEWNKTRKETVYITDEDGNRYEEHTTGIMGTANYVKMIFPVSKDMLNKKMFLNIDMDGKLYTSQIMIK